MSDKPASTSRVSSLLRLLLTNLHVFRRRLVQQELPFLAMTFSPACTLATLAALVVVLLAVGVPALVTGLNTHEVSVPYHRRDALCSGRAVCQLSFFVARPLRTPVAVYFSVTPFSPNHREYLRSRSRRQLAGEEGLLYDDLADCAPNRSLHDSRLPADLYSPCGLPALSRFNDTFSFVMESPFGFLPLPLDKSRMTLPGEERLFGNPFAKPGIVVADDYRDPDFVTWMRPSAANHVRKLLGVINTVHEVSGRVTATITNAYAVDGFGGEKRLVFAELSWLGARNPVVGVVAVCAAAITGLVLVGYVVLLLAVRRKTGDVRFLRAK